MSSVPAEHEECFGIFRGDLGTEDWKSTKKTNSGGSEAHSPTRNVCAEYGRTPASSLIRCENPLILILCILWMSSSPNAVAGYDDEVVKVQC